MKPTRHKASEKERALRAVYKGLEADGKKKDEARSEEATEMRDPTRMYFERWGLLAPPPERQLLASLTTKYSTTTRRRARSAFRRAGVQETVPLFD